MPSRRRPREPREETPALGDDTPLGEARRIVAEQSTNPRAICPCCGQHAVARRRTISSSSGVVLVLLEKRAMAGDESFVNAQHLIADALALPPEVRASIRGDFAKLRFWGLLEQQRRGRSSWRITHEGREFVAGRLRVPAAIYLFNNKLVTVGDDDGSTVSIAEVLGDAFDLGALLES